MFNTLKAMFDYLDFSSAKKKNGHGYRNYHRKLLRRERFSNSWDIVMAFSLCFVCMLGLMLEVVFSSPDQLAHIYGVTIKIKGGIEYLSVVHIIALVVNSMMSFVLILSLADFMRIFHTKVKNKKCSIFLIPIPFVLLALSCSVVFLYKKVNPLVLKSFGWAEKLMSSLWVYTVIDESEKGSISKKTKTIL